MPVTHVTGGLVRGPVLYLEKGVLQSLILKIIANIEISHLQQLDGLLQLRGHHKRLLLLDLE